MPASGPFQVDPEKEILLRAGEQVAEARPWGWISAVAILLVALGGVTWLLLLRKPVLSEKDTVVLADFSNSTGDPVFDETLRQGMAVQLE